MSVNTLVLVGRRFIIYEKGIEDQVDIASPMDVGGLKSEEYLKMNPHGKVSQPPPSSLADVFFL